MPDLEDRHIGNCLWAWQDCNEDCAVPELPAREVRRRERICESCIQGRCILTWIVTWVVIALLGIGALMTYFWSTGRFNSELETRHSTKMEIEK